MLGKASLAKHSHHLLFSLLLLMGAAGPLAAQSLDPAAPAPVRSSRLVGHIPARDLGDARLTDHYYAFTGIPGDLLITVKSLNLNGDLDVFTAGTLRPLLKLTLYAESSTPVTKGIYLRKREDLILRIEARSPNDDEGTYELFFGGAFQPIVGGADIAESEIPSADTNAVTSNGKTKRVSSVGARLPEREPPEVAAAPSATPEATPEVKAPETEQPAPTPRSTARTSPRGRRTPGRRTTTPAPVTTKPAESEAASTEQPKIETSEPVTESPKPPATKSTARNTTRRTPATSPRATKPEPAAPATEPESGPRLVIETNDGTLINRSMSTIRRVTVENGWVVVTGKDGKIDRMLLVNVVRMSIAQ